MISRLNHRISRRRGTRRELRYSYILPALIASVVFLSFAFADSAAAPVSLARMRTDLQYLCSGNLQGRLSLSPGADLAARYIADAFTHAGLTAAGTDNGFLQQFMLKALVPPSPGSLPGKGTATETSSLVAVRNGVRTAFQPGTDFRTDRWRSLDISAPVAFVGYGITAPEYGYDDYAGIDVTGKIVVAFDHEPQERDPQSIFNGTGHTRYANSAHVKLENAARHGALALLVASEPLRHHPGTFDATPGTKGTTSLRAMAPRQAIDVQSIPFLSISDRVAADLLASSGRNPAELQAAIDRDLKPASLLLPETTIRFSSTAATVRTGNSANVVGLLEGSDPELRRETVMITAHYDHLGVQNGHLYPGANDNASGTVGVMELARLFAQETHHPRRTLLFVVFGSEEEGLLGSYYYVAHPIRPLETTRAVLNLDMVARDEAHIPQSRGVVDIPANTRNEINLVGAFYSPELEAVISNANAKTGLEISTKFDRDHDLNALFRCDHFPFLLHGVPAVWLFGGWHPGYHEPSDTIERLDFQKLEKVVRLAYASAQALADAQVVPRFEVSTRHRP